MHFRHAGGWEIVIDAPAEIAKKRSMQIPSTHGSHLSSLELQASGFRCGGRERNFLALILAAIVAGLCSCTPSLKDFDELSTKAEKGDAAALKKLRAFADGDNTVAQKALGALYYFGNGVPKDHVEAVKWYRKAAETDAMAQFDLGRMYAEGSGVPADAAEAEKWFQKAVANGDAFVQSTAAYYYGQGIGVVPKNETEAATCYGKAAVQGDAYSQLNLSERYAEGRGVPTEVATAYKWILLAAAQGTIEDHLNKPRLKKLLYDLESRMTLDQRTEGQRMAREFKPTKGKK